MVITKVPMSVFPCVEQIQWDSFFLKLEDAKKNTRLSSSRFTNALLHRVVSATVICGHLNPEAPELYDCYCEELFAAIGEEPFIFLPEPGFPPVIITTLDARWMRDLSGIARRPARQHS